MIAINDLPSTLPNPADVDQQLLQIRSFGLTHPGRIRPTNEDQFLIAELTGALCAQRSTLTRSRLLLGPRGHLFIVADGMGGHKAGQHASALAVETIESFLVQALPSLGEDHHDGDDPLGDFREAVRTANARLIREGKKNPRLNGMGTTVTLSYVVGNELYLAHVGDSRCYLLRHRELRQLTHDHTLIAEFLSRGLMSEEEAAQSTHRHVVTNAVGGNDPGVKPEVARFDLQANDMLLLCSDGLTDMVANDRLREILLAESDPQAACTALIAEANANGGKDNITAVVARFDAAS